MSCQPWEDQLLKVSSKTSDVRDVTADHPFSNLDNSSQFSFLFSSHKLLKLAINLNSVQISHKKVEILQTMFRNPYKSNNKRLLTLNDRETAKLVERRHGGWAVPAQLWPTADVTPARPGPRMMVHHWFMLSSTHCWLLLEQFISSAGESQEEEPRF